MASVATIDPSAVPDYARDFAAWSHYQAMLLRSEQLHLLDRAWIAEELESWGHQEYDKLESALRIVLLHLLKWDYQSLRRSRGWTVSIAAHRDQARKHLRRNPSLAPRQEEAVVDAYRDARRYASGETDLPLKTFPATCPYSWDDIMARPIAWLDDE